MLACILCMGRACCMEHAAWRNGKTVHTGTAHSGMGHGERTERRNAWNYWAAWDMSNMARWGGS